MARFPRRPPPALISERVREYAILPSSLAFNGEGLDYVGGRELGPMPCLAITEHLKDGAIHLAHCDRDWRVVAVSEHDSVARAKRRAERVRPGASRYWRARGVSVADAKAYLARQWAGDECSFCGKTPEEESTFITGPNARMCGSCVTRAYEALRRGEDAG
jgi:hypothetical protein